MKSRLAGNRSTLLLLLAGLLTAGCGGTGASDEAAIVSTAPVPASPGPTSSAAADRATATASPAPVPSDLPQQVLLPADALEPPQGPRKVAEGTVPWRLPDACEVGAPVAAVAMRTVEQGDGQFEAPVGVQQVAVHRNSDAAAAEAQRVAAVLQDCARRAASGTGDTARYLVSPSAVGADGTELAVDYYGVTADDPTADGLGYAVVLTRRGTAVTLVAAEGGESSISNSRMTVAEQAQQAWERLCYYQVEGCA